MKRLIAVLVILVIGAVAGGAGALLWYDPMFKVPYEASTACYKAIGERTRGQLAPRYVSGGSREYGWEHWVALYDGPGPDFNNRRLLGAAHCKIISEYDIVSGKNKMRVVELTTSVDHLLR